MHIEAALSSYHSCLFPKICVLLSAWCHSFDIVVPTERQGPFACKYMRWKKIGKLSVKYLILYSFV